MMNQFLPILIATLVAGTPLVYSALGELVAERSGVLNMGVEGMMVIGAVVAFIVMMTTGSLFLAIIAAMLAAMLLALMFAVLAVSFRANQVAVGLALTIFGTSLGSYLGKSYVGMAIVMEPSVLTAYAARIPLLGSVLGQLHPLVWLSWVLFAGVWFFLQRSRAGLILKAVGEAPLSAHALGYRVSAIRYLATLFGGAMAGVAGAYISIVYTSLWTEGLIAGRGWIAVALVVFATWRPVRCFLGAYLFGGATIAQLFAQSAGIGLPSELMSALPYLVTIIVLVLISRNAALMRLNIPASLGKPFTAEG
ncbi:simple sugar transport system permease protein [Pararhizobium capsulatum DSM 1112]|uniref:Simple sugar transport system permease protein n=2 Tax=Pararhizobium capsulatum TaxID=34014 RepID=A0ABU0BS46_9HYPH|nr:simple sugar transport system permease protein [Pararhizobium capsulatum DSM 1112]